MPPPIFGDGAAGAALGTSGAVAPPPRVSPQFSAESARPVSPRTPLASAGSRAPANVVVPGTTASSAAANSDQHRPARLGAVGSEEAALAGGVWQTDSSQIHATSRRQVKAPASSSATGSSAEPDSRRTFRVCYLFSGVQRRASIAEALQKLCDKAGVRLIIEEVDILVGGASHNLLDEQAQES